MRRIQNQVHERGYTVDVAEAANEELVESLLPAAVGSMATRVVREAAGVLEQELAAGIRAVRRMEERYIDVTEIRSRSPEHVMQRFRADAHEVVDILFDLFTVATDSAEQLVERAFVIGAGGNRPRISRAHVAHSRTVQTTEDEDARSEPDLPVLSPPIPILPGQALEFSIVVDNPASGPTSLVTFGCADLVSAEGGVIEASSVVFLPSSLVLAPQSSERIVIQVRVPRDAEPGSYRGMFWADSLPSVRAMLVVPVAFASEVQEQEELGEEA